MKLIIAGGRDHMLTADDYRQLAHLHVEHGITEIVTGGAPGVDADGEFFGRRNGIPVRVFPADWAKHGRAAGPIRNRQMAEYADAVALFSGGNGTASMAAEAARAGIQSFDYRKS